MARKIKRKGKKEKRVAIVGKGPGRGLAPRVAPFEVWGINNTWVGQRCTMVVDVHDLDWNLQECIDNYTHLRGMFTEEEIEKRAHQRMQAFRLTKEHCIKTNTPLVSQKLYKLDGVDVPGFVYPLEKIIEKYDCDLFSSATPYAIAYAIFKKYTHIDLFGINCLHGEEWAQHRDGVVGWLMYAKALGIKVTVTGQEGRPLRAWDGMMYGFYLPQKKRPMTKEVDGSFNIETEELVEFDVWREYN